MTIFAIAYYIIDRYLQKQTFWEVKRVKLDIGKIELIMAEKGLTKSAMSEKCGVSRQNISNKGTCEPRTAGRLATGLGVNVTEILAEI